MKPAPIKPAFGDLTLNAVGARLRALNLKAKVLLLASLVIIAGSLALAVRVAAVMQRDLEHMITTHLSSSLDYVASDLDANLRTRMAVLTELAAALTPDLLSDPAKVQRVLEARNLPRALFPLGVFVTDKSGTVIADHPHLEGRLHGALGAPDFFARTLATGEPSVGKPTIGPFVKKAIVPLAAPLRDERGAPAGVLTGASLLADPGLFGEMEKAKFGSSGFVIVLAPQHKLVVWSTDKERILTPMPARGVNPLMDRRVDEGFEGVGIVVDSQGVETLAVGKRLKTTEWMAVAGVATDKAFASIRTLKRQIYVAALAMSLISVISLYFLLKRQLTPLSDAARAMRRMTEGTRPLSPLPVARDDEIGELVGSFNRLVEERARLDDALMKEIGERRQAQADLGRHVEELARAHAKVREGEAQLRSVIESVPVMVASYDAECRCLYANHWYASFFGTRAEEIPGKPLHEVIGAQANDAVTGYVRRVLAGETVKYTRVHRPADGRAMYLDASLIPDRADDGSVKGFFALTVDVTEREQTLQALRASEARFRALTEMSSDWLWEQDAELRFVDLHQDATVGGVDLNKGVGKKRWELPVAGVTEEQWRAHRNALERHEPFDDFVFQIAGAKGELRWHSITGRPVFAPDGTFLGYRGTGRDITAQKVAEENLRESEQRFRVLVEHAPTAIVVFDVDLDRLVDANPLAERMFQMPREELLKEHPLRFYPQRQPDGIAPAESFRQHRERILAGEQLVFERLIRGARGRETLCEVRAVCLPAAKRRLVSMSLIDITARKRTEEQIRELNRGLERRVAQRTQELVVANENLASEIEERKTAESAATDYSVRLQEMTRRYVGAQEAERRKLARELHDRVSSSLTAIGLNLGLIERQLPDKTAAKVKSRLTETMALVADTISSSRDISFDLHPAVLDYAGVLPALEDYGRKYAGRTGISVEVTGTEELRLPPEREIALYRIAQEALTNCAKHAGARNAQVELVSDDERVILTISDDGAGFDPASLNGVKRANGGNGEEASKPGLGLLSMRERAEAIGARFEIESLPDQGTRVRVTLEHGLQLN